MRISLTIKILLTALIAAPLISWGYLREGAKYTMAYESINGGGVSYAANGLTELGGSIGQSGFQRITSNAVVQALNGFWKGESGCLVYPTEITEYLCGTNSVTVSFTVARSNSYTVVFLNEEDGGLDTGQGFWTNEVAATFTSADPVGTITSIVHNLIGSTNRARFYKIICE